MTISYTSRAGAVHTSRCPPGPPPEGHVLSNRGSQYQLYLAEFYFIFSENPFQLRTGYSPCRFSVAQTLKSKRQGWTSEALTDEQYSIFAMFVGSKLLAGSSPGGTSGIRFDLPRIDPSPGAQFNNTQATALEGIARSTNTLQKSMIRDVHTYHESVELEKYFVKWISPLN